MSQHPPPNPYWIPAKRYGWGWGTPTRWQGWVVMLAFIALMIANGILLAPHHLALFYAVTLISGGLLIAICYAKGEPPKWRWGD